MGVDLIYHI